MDRQRLQRDIQKRVRSKVFPLLVEYGLETGPLDAVLKWKPVVLLLGNYSSGKSTLVNELLGREVQMTGQAPTDDSFTVLTAPGSGMQAGLVPGATLVNDDSLPFTALKSYGDRLISHLQMKLVDTDVLRHLAIVDSPGMLDSVTEKGRGYDFSGVVGELAKLADLVVLMFDPHKAGTIKETYTTIRGTLPETSDEDRVVFVMSRIDECDNPGDLMRSYGTLCWNLSQMTGRKDIPRIFMTFAPCASASAGGLEAWVDERAELKRRILDTPDLKIGHILHVVDRKMAEVKLLAEALGQFAREGRRAFHGVLRRGILVGGAGFFLLDLVIHTFMGAPHRAFLPSLLSGQVGAAQLVVPVAAFLGAMGCAVGWFVKWRFPRYRRRSVQAPDGLVRCDTDDRRNLWRRVRETACLRIQRTGVRGLYYPHHRNMAAIDRFVAEDLKKFFTKHRKPGVAADAETPDGAHPAAVEG